MSTVTLSTSSLTRARDVFILFSKKGAFVIEEYGDAHAVYKRVAAALESSNESGSSEIGEVDVKYLISAINVCSQRTPVEVQNFKPISDLVEELTAAINNPDDEVKSSVTEL